MDYEIVHLEERKVAGLCARTSNRDPQMSDIIGSLWQRFYGEGILARMTGMVNDHGIGLYSDYESGADGQYDVTIGVEVSAHGQLPEGITLKTIPKGNYAKFVLTSGEISEVGTAWQEIWKLPLDRRFTGDFEEYVPGPDGKLKEILLFIAINE